MQWALSDSPPIVLAISGSDPTSGAGLQADVLTIASMQCHPVTAVPAVTLQDTRGVKDFFALDRNWITEQIRCVAEDMTVAACKVGMLGSAHAVEAVAEALSEFQKLPVVVDPVLVSGRGDSLASLETVEALKKHLLPLATLVTPNSLEARRLAGADDLEACAMTLLGYGCRYVLVTGSHEDTQDVVNSLYDLTGLVRSDRWPRLAGGYHGSGCTLASACAAAIAKGFPIPEAVGEAQSFTWHSLKHAFRAGKGQAIPNRFWKKDDERLD
jgi:hydroxymethylpyrimidine/phosphomethylpyrimidine kinase